MKEIYLAIVIISIIGIIILLIIPKNTFEKVKDLKISKRRFVELVLFWCQQNLGESNNRYTLKIHYYQNKKYSGTYILYGKLITIYITNDLELLDLTDTIIHEYVHYLQILKEKDQLEYNKKFKEVGYWNVPYEIEARQKAKQHRNECFKWVMGQI